METGMHVVASERHAGSQQFSDRFYQDCMTALGRKKGEAALILDDRGEVLYGNKEGAKIFDIGAEIMVGEHVSSFVHNIRLHRWTPGSNVAYAGFSGSRNQWREYCLVDAKGRSFSAELQLDVLVLNLRYLILLWIRTAEKRSPEIGERSDAASLVSGTKGALLGMTSPAG